MPVPRILALVVAAVLAAGTFAADAAPRKKHRLKRALAAVPTIIYDYDGTPIIMKGYSRPRIAPGAEPNRRADRSVARPRGSSTYIMPPVPSPDAPNSPPSSVLLQPPSPPVVPPRINTFQDRVINCIHAAPLNTGVGNNPANTQAYIGQCAN